MPRKPTISRRGQRWRILSLLFPDSGRTGKYERESHDT
jgi:hypothetical protein